MDLKRKIEIVAMAIESLAGHTDADSVVRLAALDEVLLEVNAAKKAVASESAKEIAALTAVTEA
jgi:hypothetical protein